MTEEMVKSKHNKQTGQTKPFTSVSENGFRRLLLTLVRTAGTSMNSNAEDRRTKIVVWLRFISRIRVYYI